MAMLYRKITSYIEDYLKSDNDKILILEGARQIGKSFSIREAGTRLYPNFVEINFVEDDEGEQLFKNIHKKDDFYLTLSMVAGDKLNNRDDTLVFLDEIQHYSQYLTMLKFLREDNRYRFIANGSLLGATMNVGAESVTDRGLYFAWGETTGHAFGSGYEFSLDNYAWYNSTDKFTKYKHDGSSWDYEELASEDDAAAKIWGGVWRIPTKAEWEELLNEDNCTWTWTTDYKGDGTNVAGVIVTSKKVGYTDKSIFLPATGIYTGGDINTGSEIWATYWSKSLDTNSYKSYGFAWKLEILYNEGSLYYRRVQNENRYYGIGVRAVRE